MSSSLRWLHTSSFRLTLRYVALTGLSFVLLFAVVYIATSRFMDQQLDATVAAELHELQTDAREKTPNGMVSVVQDLRRRTHHYLYQLQDAHGQVLVGDEVPPLDPTPGIREWPDAEHRPHTALSGIRGQGVVLDDGRFLFVGVHTEQRHEMQELLIHAFLWGLLGALLIALAGGTLVSLQVARQIASVSHASRDIMAGDLSRRIPITSRNDEFDHLAVSLNAMLERIQHLMAGLRQVTDDIAHDLRTPLTRLRQHLERAQRRIGAPHTELEAAQVELEGALATFSALLRIAHIESGARKAGFTTVNLVASLRAVIELYQAALDERHHALTVTLDEPLWIRGDHELLTQLWVNLLENVLRHCPEGTAVHIEARRLEHEIEVCLADRGDGIPAALRDKVLQRFFRLDSSRTTPGNGLGLSLVAAIADLHEATLSLHDHSPGLRVCLRFATAQEGAAATRS